MKKEGMSEFLPHWELRRELREDICQQNKLKINKYI